MGIGCVKLSLLRRKYLSSAVNVLICNCHYLRNENFFLNNFLHFLNQYFEHFEHYEHFQKNDDS